MLFFRRILPVALTVSIGWLVLVSFLLPGLVIPLVSIPLTSVRAFLVEWAVILAAGALVLGFINLVGVHARRIRQGQAVIFSAFLVGSALFTLGLWIRHIASLIVERELALSASIQDMGFFNGIFNLVIAPMQSALGALLAILLAVAGYRALRVRRSAGMFLFVLTAVFVVLTQPAALFREILEPIRAGLIDPITTGSLRGLLIGVALGSIAVGLRLLFFADKPQGD